MSVKRLVTWIALSVLVFLGMATISTGANMEIKQEGHLYRMPLTQNVFTETFVLSPVSKQEELKKKSQQADQVAPEKTARFTKSPVTRITNPIIVYFQIDSYELDPGERNKMISKIEALRIPKGAPLSVTGFTCQKGPEEFNTWLSDQRAKTVAKYLQKHGYSVTKMKGLGSENLVARNFPPFNRRVEIVSAQ